jgi:hypothetical protein
VANERGPDSAVIDDYRLLISKADDETDSGLIDQAFRSGIS